MIPIKQIIELMRVLQFGRGDIGSIGVQRRDNDNKTSGQRQAGY